MLSLAESLIFFAAGVVTGVFLDEYEILTAADIRRATRYSCGQARQFVYGEGLKSAYSEANVKACKPGKTEPPIV